MLAFFLAYRAWRRRGRPAWAAAMWWRSPNPPMVFIAATVLALVVSRWRLGRISPMLWLSSALVIFFGGMTVILHDATWCRSSPR
jgi:intracellular septation protein